MENNAFLKFNIRSFWVIVLTILFVIGVAAITELFYFDPMGDVTPSSAIEQLLFKWYNCFRYQGVFMNALLLVFTSAILYKVDSDHRLFQTKSNLIFSIYILMAATNPAFTFKGFSPLVVFIFVTGLYLLFQGYGQKRNYVHYVFNFFFCISLVSLIDSGILLLMPLFIWGVWQMKIMSKRSLLGGLIGLGLPYFFVTLWVLYMGVENPLKFEASIGLIDTEMIQPYEWLHIGYTFLLAVISIVGAISSNLVTKIKIRAMITFFMATLLSCAGLFVISSDFFVYSLGCFYVTTAFLFARFLSSNLTGNKEGLLIFTYVYYLIILIWSIWLS